MIRIGRYNTLRVNSLADAGAFLGDGDDEVLLLADEVPEGTEVGARLRVFVYVDTDDIPVATTVKPLATVGQFAFLEVVDTFEHGAFVDWGLDKDLLVPIKEQQEPLEVGDRRVFYIDVHERTNRLIASQRLGRHFDYEPDHFKPNHQVQAMVYGFHDAGVNFVVDGKYRGLAYHNEVYRELAVGEVVTAWVKEVREDGRLDLSLQRLGRGAALDARDVILEALEAAGGFLPLHDKSSPDAIRDALAMSKGTFKKAIGALYRERRISLERGGIRLS
ncbi:MAG: GntR family transcriptional regulator [Deltaproteobacteria bacterium]|nr:MAG: GntR family transcriptional regulator [Deltaproteobacteria bacterium]